MSDTKELLRISYENNGKINSDDELYENVFNEDSDREFGCGDSDKEMKDGCGGNKKDQESEITEQVEKIELGDKDSLIHFDESRPEC
ncbi:hypothetical protein JTB14_028154 [Gonioctena quinquepunctata]|nr:hypothetical protein JTB14_028154 [Gonioctena quinquepunctata]